MTQDIHPVIHAALRPWIPTGPPRHPGWRIAAEAFQRADPACEECDHCHTDVNMAPYGESHAPEGYSECRLGQYARDKPEDCPAYQAYVQSLAEEPTEETEAQP